MSGYTLAESAVMDLTDALHGLTPQALAELLGAHITTARRWLRARKAPRAVMAALMVLRFGDLGAICPAWQGWCVRDGLLWSPEGAGFSPGQVRAGPLHEQAAAYMRFERQAAMRAAESDAERVERVAALAALSSAHAAAAAAMARLAEGLTPQEQHRLFSEVGTTRRQHDRAGFGSINND